MLRRDSGAAEPAGASHHDQLTGICGLVESLLAADPGGLGARLQRLVSLLGQHSPSSPQLNAWLVRMYGLAVSSGKNFFPDVRIKLVSSVSDPDPYWICVLWPSGYGSVFRVRIRIQVPVIKKNFINV